MCRLGSTANSANDGNPSTPNHTTRANNPLLSENLPSSADSHSTCDGTLLIHSEIDAAARSRRAATLPGPDCCDACRALLAECGDDLFPMYSRNLLKRSWPGAKSAVERAYIRAHRSPAASKAAKAAGKRLDKSRFLPSKHTTQTALVDKVVSGHTSAPNDENTSLSDRRQTAEVPS